MPNTMDGIFGIHNQALQVRAARTKVLASNLANVDTPNYKAKDIEFKSAMAQAGAGSQKTVRQYTTHPNHIAMSRSEFDTSVKYRVPHQSSLDGNTVENDIEQSRFAKNAIQYQATLNFIDGKSKSIIKALKGE